MYDVTSGINTYLDPVKELVGNTVFQIAVTILVTWILQIVINRTLNRIVKRAVRGHSYISKSEEIKREKTLSNVFHKTSAIALWIIAVIVILYQLDVNLAALLTGAGVLGVVIGFGAQNAIKDYLAGIFIITENQYRVGDIVTLYAGGANVSGIVEDITIRITRLRDLDGNLHIIPNGTGGVVTNRSFLFANVNIDLQVSYDTDLEKAMKVINDVGAEQAKDEKWQPSVYEPVAFLRVDSFNDSSVTLKAIGKVEPAMQWDVAGDYRLRIKKAFDKHKIMIPFPQVVVHQSKPVK